MTTTICLFDEVYLNGSHGAGRSISLRAAGAVVGCRVDLDREMVWNKLALLQGSPLFIPSAGSGEDRCDPSDQWQRRMGESEPAVSMKLPLQCTHVQ